MKAVVQRVRDAKVLVEGKTAGKIERGLLVYLGVARSDTEKDAVWMADKVCNLRIYGDENGKMNLSLKDMIDQGIYTASASGVLAISQFTLLGDAAKGRRPSYGEAAEPEPANNLYELFMAKIREQGLVCEAGIFRAHMEVYSVNDGPVTILLDSPYNL